MKTNYERNRVADLRYGDGTYTKAPTIYFALFIAMPTVAGNDFTEVTGGAYGRVALTNNATNFPDNVAGLKSNGVVIEWPVATANWGVVLGVGLFDDPTAGNLMDFAPLQGGSQNIANGNRFSLPIGAVQFTET